MSFNLRFRWNGFERAAHVIGHVLFRVPEVEMTRAALQINHDDIFSFAPAGTAAFAGFAGESLQFQQRAERSRTSQGCENFARLLDRKPSSVRTFTTTVKSPF